MKSSIKISNNGNTIRFTGAAANEMFKALTKQKEESPKDESSDELENVKQKALEKLKNLNIDMR